MTDTPQSVRARRFATTLLPWLIAVAALAGYLATLNDWVSLPGLAVLARARGWDWQSQAQHPLAFLVFYPFRALPADWIAPALNAFTSLCAALTLLLLARSVAVWPQDRTRPQWWREENEHGILSIPTAWLAPFAAVAACGLQLTFWENATSATGEMLDLLLFAWTVHALLYFRITQKSGWLYSAALAFAAGMADNWTFLFYAPALLAAIVWLKGFDVLSPRFAGTMLLCALAGWSLYLLLPLIQSHSAIDPVDFGAGVKAALRFQKNAVRYLPAGTLAALGFTAGLPLLAISICWRGRNPNFADDSLVGSVLAKGIFHFVHAVFLLASIWLMLDSAFSPRRVGHGLPLLTQYYLSSLVIGYCVGYFLLVGTVDVPKWVAISVYSVLGIVLAVELVFLWARNLPQIRITNGPLLREHAGRLARGIPTGNAFAISDDPADLLLVRAALAGGRRGPQALLLDSRALVLPAYQRFLAQRYSAQWPYPAPTNGGAIVNPRKTADRVAQLPGAGVYLQPSDSFWLERFEGRPAGSVVLLTPYEGDAIEVSSSAYYETNQPYWQHEWSNSLAALRAFGEEKPAAAGLARLLRLPPEQNAARAFVAASVSRSLDYWGVCAQRNGRLAEAGTWFERALVLKPGNLSAQINLTYNRQLRAGDGQPLAREMAEREFLDDFSRYRSWDAAVSDNGPLDEPTFLFETARVLLARGCPRQATEAFARCGQLASEWVLPNLWLAQTFLGERDYEGALKAGDKAQAIGLPTDQSGLAQYLFCRATALQALNRTNEAARCISEFVARHPEQEEVLSIAARLYLQQMDYQPAARVLEQLTRREPGNAEYLSNKGLAEIQLSQFDSAIATLSEALRVAPTNNVARLNRGIAYLRAGRLEKAGEDYEALLSLSPDSTKVLFGLGEIAWRKRDTNAAIQYYEKCLEHRLPDAGDRRLVAERLKELKPAAVR
jgi:tetratricopeptide (TPR) repeat protein